MLLRTILARHKAPVGFSLHESTFCWKRYKHVNADWFERKLWRKTKNNASYNKTLRIFTADNLPACKLLNYFFLRTLKVADYFRQENWYPPTLNHGATIGIGSGQLTLHTQNENQEIQTANKNEAHTFERHKNPSHANDFMRDWRSEWWEKLKWEESRFFGRNHSTAKRVRQSLIQ